MLTPDTRAATVEALRGQIAKMERHGELASRAASLPFGLSAMDRHLPAGGLLLGALHELQAAGPDVETGAAPALFAAGALARRPGPVLWISRHGSIFAHGLLQAGLDPRRVVFVDAGKAALLAMEEALRHHDVAGVVCELEGKLDLVTSRRLQLAAEASQVLGFILRRSRCFNDPAFNQLSAVMTRWGGSARCLRRRPSRMRQTCPACVGRCGGWSWRGAWIGTSNFSGLGSIKNAFGVRIGIVHTATNTT